MTLKTSLLASLFALGILMPMHNAYASTFDDLFLAFLSTWKGSKAPACPSPGDIRAAGPIFNDATDVGNETYNVSAPSRNYGADDRNWTFWINDIPAASREEAIEKANGYTKRIWQLPPDKAGDQFITWSCTYQIEGAVLAEAFSI